MDKITEELVNENLALSKEVQRLKEGPKDADIVCSFSIVELANKPFTIRGVLLAEGLWKGVKFSYDNFKKIAQMFVGIPLLKDHGHTKEFGKFQGGEVKRVIPNDNLRCLEFEAEVSSEDFAKLIKSGQVDAVSPKANWRVNDQVYPPEMVDCNEAIELSLTNSPVCTFCSIFNMEMSMFKENLNTETDSIIAMEDEKGPIEYTEFAVWTSAYVNDLPNSSFAYIESGGKNDASGKTVPRSLRHLPYKDANGKVDLPHVRNALARLDGTQIPDSVKTGIRSKLEGILKRTKG
jgi:hypothetical protein